jgi:hypothetical protein
MEKIYKLIGDIILTLKPYCNGKTELEHYSAILSDFSIMRSTNSDIIIKLAKSYMQKYGVGEMLTFDHMIHIAEQEMKAHNISGISLKNRVDHETKQYIESQINIIMGHIKNWRSS